MKPTITVATIVFIGQTVVAGADCGPADAGRPRVGLALSGGGARGLAHIGVLDVLEEEGIAVDCVAGTSMGSAIGALWASGYSTAQIGEIVESLDWQEVFSGRRVRALIPLSRRMDDVSPSLRVRLEKLRPRLPPARDSDYRLNRLLIKLLTAPGLQAQGDFERLPVPFRTVATDLATAQPVVFTRGSLPRAVRASMSTPVLMPTTEVDGRFLVDGGIVDNVPVDLVRAMGADVVIAVDASSPPTPPGEWRDILGVGYQLVDALMREHARKWAQEPDMVVTPPLGGRRYDDYSDPARLIEAGRTAARAALARLRELAPRPAGRPVPTASPSAPLIVGVAVRGQRRVAASAILAAFGSPVPDRLDTERLVRGLDRV